jgi:hypothetical protein
MSSADIQVIGEAVFASYLADPVVSRGQFRVENRGSSTVRAAVESAWLRIDGRRQVLDHVSLFDIDTDRQLDPKNVDIEPGQVMTFWLGFRPLPHQQRAREVAVGIRLAGASPTPIEAESPVHLVRRIPRNDQT